MQNKAAPLSTRHLSCGKEHPCRNRGAGLTEPLIVQIWGLTGEKSREKIDVPANRLKLRH